MLYFLYITFALSSYFFLDPVISSSMLFNVHIFVCVFSAFLQLVFNVKTLQSEKMLDIISIFFNLLRLAYTLICGVSLIMFHVLQRRTYFLMLWGERLSICELCSFGLVFHLRPFSVFLIYHSCQWDIEVLYVNWVFVSVFFFFFQCCQQLLYILVLLD